MGTDLAKLDTARGADAGFELQLLDPVTQIPLEAWITVHGSDGEAYREASRQLRARNLDRIARGGPVNPSDVHRAEDNDLELLSAVTAGWRGLDEDGKALEFSASAARQLYGRYPWIKEQVDRAVHRRANFLPRAATPS